MNTVKNESTITDPRVVEAHDSMKNNYRISSEDQSNRLSEVPIGLEFDPTASAAAGPGVKPQLTLSQR